MAHGRNPACQVVFLTQEIMINIWVQIFNCYFFSTQQILQIQKREKPVWFQGY
jgi:hypothetical protein